MQAIDRQLPFPRILVGIRWPEWLRSRQRQVALRKAACNDPASRFPELSTAAKIRPPAPSSIGIPRLGQIYFRSGMLTGSAVGATNVTSAQLGVPLGRARKTVFVSLNACCALVISGNAQNRAL